MPLRVDLPSRIYHLALRGQWQHALDSGAGYRRSTLGKSLEDVGYIHCCFADQVREIADLFYSGRNDVVLLEIDPLRLKANVRIENSERGNQKFPHIYGPLPTEAVVRAREVSLGRGGRPMIEELLRADSHGDAGGHVHLDEADWEAMVAHTELEGELLLPFVTDTARWIAELRGPDAPPVRRVLDVGSGPGVGACELARLFQEAQIVAVDGSPAMLERAAQRAAEHGLDQRITTHLAELPDGLDDLDHADVIWASMSLHHVGDETNAFRGLRGLLERSGVLALAEFAEPMRVLPDDLDVGRPGLAERLSRAGSDWFASMRGALPGSVPSTDLASMLTSAGYDVVGSRLARRRFDPPLSDAARRVAVRHIRRARHQLEGLLDDDDLRTLDVLNDPDDPRSVSHRPDVFVAASRHIVIAQPAQDP